MAVMLRFPHRSTADPNARRHPENDAQTASIIILPCVRREAMGPVVAAPATDPVLLKA